jgi:hypothetical protein
MKKLRDDEVRRLVSYLRPLVSDEELARIEDILRSDEGAEYLLTDALLVYFPLVSLELGIDERSWQVRILPHAHLRMVQRGVSTHDMEDLLIRFVKTCQMRGELIIEDYHGIVGRTPRHASVTLRVAVEEISEQAGRVRVITVHGGRGWSAAETVVHV